LGEWCLDSGGFSELSIYGKWMTSHQEYVDAVGTYQQEIGNLQWCAPQDWMCEPWIIGKTGLSVEEHQERTIASYIALRDVALPVIPVLQGWLPADYENHVERYTAMGVDLRETPLVGLGSVCRRNTVGGLEELLIDLTNYGIKLHGFGFKRNGLGRFAYLFESADSMAWSFTARRSEPLPGCTHKSCTNCLRYALKWRESVVRACDLQQPSLWSLA
jgi:hypothetical protein